MSDSNNSKFDIWWNSPSVKRAVGAAYSIGAAVVIIGAMFKILHLPGAALMLGIGMTVEAILFSMGILDKPHKEYHWEKVFDFDGEEGSAPSAGAGIASKSHAPVSDSVSTTTQVASPTRAPRAVGLDYTETIDDQDVMKLTESIKKLTKTADQFSELSSVVGATNDFVKTIDNASMATGEFIKGQESLNTSTNRLSTAYTGITDGMDLVEKNTQLYASKVEVINKNLSSINSIYEIQLKNIHAQSESLKQQTESVRTVNNELNVILSDVEKMKVSTLAATVETEKFKMGTTKLAKQIGDLNQVYGNMLNALN
jgi:gliding motility-associated protein GldL